MTITAGWSAGTTAAASRTEVRPDSSGWNVPAETPSGEPGASPRATYAALQREGESRSGLYTIDLRSGRAFRAGHIGSSQPVETLAILRPGKHGGWGHGYGHRRGRR